MRLKPNEINILKSSIHNYIKDAKIILFGSRVYDYKKGGDIDILVETNHQITLEEQIKILTDIQLNGIYRKVDLLFKTPYVKEQSIFKTIDEEGIVL